MGHLLFEIFIKEKTTLSPLYICLHSLPHAKLKSKNEQMAKLQFLPLLREKLELTGQLSFFISVSSFTYIFARSSAVPRWNLVTSYS